jgi:hypothetical protein
MNLANDFSLPFVNGFVNSRSFIEPLDSVFVGNLGNVEALSQFY